MILCDNCVAETVTKHGKRVCPDGCLVTPVATRSLQTKPDKGFFATIKKLWNK
jgi:hypothetical protein